jgi:glycosyltransferase involved in cell wall biosynthesis
MKQVNKILFVVDGLWVGGTERSLAEMLPYLVQANIRPIIACFNRYQAEGIEQDVLSQGFDVRFLNGSGLMSRVRALHQLIKLEQPDLIHTALFKADIIGRLAAIGCSAPIMSSLVNPTYDPVRFQDPNIKAIKLRLVQMIDAWTGRHLTTHFHAVSKAVKAAAIKTMRIQPERITVVERGRNPIRLGQPTPERCQRARQKLGLQAEDKVIVNVGRHEFQKGQKYLLKAMARLVCNHPRLVLLVAGRSGHASSELEYLRDQLDLKRHVRFLGHRNDIPEILAAADLFVFPTLFEGLPGAVIEAMALGLPIVATDIAPLQEVVEANRNALLVEPASSIELATAIERLLDDRQQAATFAQRSREIFEARFTLEQSVSRMIELYHQVASLKIH